LGVTFGGFTSINGSFAVAMPDGKGWQWSASTTTSSAYFNMFAGNFGQQPPPITGTGGASCGICACNATVTGFFSGATAERAGVAYHIQDGSTNVLGAAAFKKD
jgi:hypothetical protein